MISKLKFILSDGTGKPATANLFVANSLRKAIVSGVLKAGMPLRQEELAAAFDVSRIPVREALRQLEAEGLIVFKAHKGATVAKLSTEELMEITEMRIALEVLALRLSVPKMAAADLREAEGILDEMDEEKDLSRLCTLHIRFHLGLYSAANRKRLVATIESLHQKIERYVMFQVGQMSYAKHGQSEHRELLRLCAAHDVEGACDFLERHIQSAAESLVDMLSKMQMESVSS